ncbi:MAG: competence/damage-inducible protein A [Phycisphaeraceae bacterium]|nr:competence/damage-inducible protein A [Phycisphaeraceae bacterium]
MQVVIISIGDELVLGQTVDTNSAWIAATLIEQGISVAQHVTVSDDLAAITRTIQEEVTRADWLILTGGLGPTDDDLTREALAEACGRPLEIDPVALDRLERFFTDRGRTMPERNRKQAMVPRGHKSLENPHGTAPGLLVTINGCRIAAMPGVPAEMRPMLRNLVLPRLTADQPDGPGFILTSRINTFGWGESDVGRRLGTLMDRKRNPRVGTTISDGIVAVRIRSEASDRTVAEAHLEATAEEIESCLNPMAFGRDDQTLEGALLTILLERNLKLVTAESCTGGGLGEMITRIPGSSAAYNGGWICYSNEMKIQQLGIDPEIILLHGAVSEPVASAMAMRSLELGHADLALAVTGVAGPEGGTEQKPVGTIWMALAIREAQAPPTVWTAQSHLSGDRLLNRDRAAKTAMQMARLALIGQPLELLSWVRIGGPSRSVTWPA